MLSAKYRQQPLWLLPFFLCNHGYAEQQGVEIISVSATYDAVAVQQQSQSVAVISSEDINLRSATHIAELLNTTPSVWLSRGNGQEHLTAIRSPVFTGAGACGAFMMAQDGVGLRSPFFCNTNQLFEVNAEQATQVEVIRGPASVLYGSNAMHGVIDVQTPMPADLPRFGLSAETGSNGFNRVSSQFNHLGKDLDIGGYGLTSKDSGYQDSSGYNQQKLNLVATSENDGFSHKTTVSLQQLDQQTAGYVQGNDAYRDPQLRRENPNPDAYRKAHSMRLQSRMQWQADNNSRVQITPYWRSGNMDFLQHYLPWQSVENNRYWSTGALFRWQQQYNDSSLTLGVDTDYSRGHLNEDQVMPFSPTIPQGQHYDYSVSATAISPFAVWQKNWHSWKFEGGLRFDKLHYDYDNQLTDGSACEAGIDNCRFYRPADQTRNYHHWSPQLSLGYNTEQTYYYLQLNQGFRIPQATELFRLQGPEQPLQPEQLNNLTLGSRGQLGPIQYDLSWYLMHKSHVLIQNTDRLVVNEGDTRHQGIEWSFSWQSDTLDLGVSGSYSEHQYDSAVAISNSDINGNWMDTAPRQQHSAYLKWSATGDISVNIDWQYQGDYYLNPENTASYPGHQRTDVAVNWQFHPQVSVSLRANNVFDQDIAERADYAFGNYRYFIGLPRALYLKLSWNL